MTVCDSNLTPLCLCDAEKHCPAEDVWTRPLSERISGGGVGLPSARNLETFVLQGNFCAHG